MLATYYHTFPLLDREKMPPIIFLPRKTRSKRLLLLVTYYYYYGMTDSHQFLPFLNLDSIPRHAEKSSCFGLARVLLTVNVG